MVEKSDKVGEANLTEIEDELFVPGITKPSDRRGGRWVPVKGRDPTKPSWYTSGWRFILNPSQPSGESRNVSVGFSDINFDKAAREFNRAKRLPGEESPQ